MSTQICSIVNIYNTKLRFSVVYRWKWSDDFMIVVVVTWIYEVASHASTSTVTWLGANTHTKPTISHPLLSTPVCHLRPLDETGLSGTVSDFTAVILRFPSGANKRIRRHLHVSLRDDGGGGSRDMRFLLSLELRQRSSPGPSDATPVICKQRARQWDLFLWYSLFFTDQASCFPLRNWIIPCFSAPTSSHLYHWRIHLIYNTIFNILRLHHHPLLYCTSVSDTLTN